MMNYVPLNVTETSELSERIITSRICQVRDRRYQKPLTDFVISCIMNTVKLQSLCNKFHSVTIRLRL